MIGFAPSLFSRQYVFYAACFAGVALLAARLPASFEVSRYFALCWFRTDALFRANIIFRQHYPINRAPAADPFLDVSPFLPPVSGRDLSSRHFFFWQSALADTLGGTSGKGYEDITP